MDSWRTGTNIYFMLVAESGSGKSGAVGVCVKEISKIQQEEMEVSKKTPRKRKCEDSSDDSSPSGSGSYLPVCSLFCKVEVISWCVSTLSQFPVTGSQPTGMRVPATLQLRRLLWDADSVQV